MRFFSKIAVFCNACFLVAVVLWYIEMGKKADGIPNQVLPLPWLEGTFVILGYLAIVVNALFLLLYFIFFSFKLDIRIPRWILVINILIFCCQLYFHFIFK